MEFNKDKVYTALNADELKVGSKVAASDNIATLKEKVERNDFRILTAILAEHAKYRFRTVKFINDAATVDFIYAYLVSEPEEKKLKWQDLKIGDVIRCKFTGIKYLITAVDSREHVVSHIFIDDSWISDDAISFGYEKDGC